MQGAQDVDQVESCVCSASALCLQGIELSEDFFKRVVLLICNILSDE